MYLLFVGENASTGSPNAMTGLMSTYGQIYAYRTKEERHTAALKFRRSGDYSLVAPCSPTTARKYCLGMSVESYKEYVKAITSGI